MGLKGKIFKFMSDILKDGSYYKLYTQAKSTSACGLPNGFFYFGATHPLRRLFCFSKIAPQKPPLGTDAGFYMSRGHDHDRQRYIVFSGRL